LLNLFLCHTFASMRTTKKNILLLFALLQAVITFSQLSNKHWIPPLHMRSSGQIRDHHIYISTPETTPFLVTITTGNGTAIPGSPFSVSAASPVSVEIGNGQPTDMFLNLADVNVVKNDKGLIISGAKDFYCSFRMRDTNHAETLVSKGRAGIGTSFRLGHQINEGTSTDIRKTFMASVMATENNTVINLSQYNPGVIFSSGSGNITDDSQNFTLNAGESIVFSGNNDIGNNLTGFLGALLTSTKPVAVNSGNMMGGTDASADMNMDQIVSNAQIGNEYIFIQGNGTPEMELPLIIADQDNTEVRVNGSVTPNVTLNAGQFYFVPNSFYQGTNAANTNIYVKTSKNVFAYQLLGGAFNPATSGMNFIPPLSCFFQSSVNIPAINRIGTNTYSADLMVLTYSNASISINGTPISNTNAQTVAGNLDWVTYRLSGYTGNVNVVSTGPVAVGVFGFSGAAGFGGYYSGFGSNPRDTPVTVCSSTTKNIFDAIDGNPEPGGTWAVPAGGAPIVANIFDPAVNIPGEYTYTFSKACNTASVGISVKVLVSIQNAGFPGTDTVLNICKNDTSINLFGLLGTGITPGGVWSSTNATSPALIAGVFNPATNVSDTYTYTIAATGVCPAFSASVRVNNYNFPIVSPISNYELCDDLSDGNDTNGSNFFNLVSKTPEIVDSQTGLVVTYHTNNLNAITGNSPITTYTGTDTTIHVRLTNPITNCFSTTSFAVKVNPLPIVTNVVTLSQCDDDTDAISSFNLTEANVIISNPSDIYSFTYFNSENDALTNTGAILDPTNVVAANNAVFWARIYTAKDCFRVSQVNLLVSATQIPSTFQPITIEECDNFIDLTNPTDDGITIFNMSNAGNQILGLFPATQNLSVSYYLNEADALAEENKITTFTAFRNTLPNNQTIWVRLDSPINNGCVGFGPYINLIVNPLPLVTLIDSDTLCIDPITLAGNYQIDATVTTTGSYTYNWTPTNTNLDALGNQSPIFNANQPGIYKVKVTNTVTNCVRDDQFELFVSSPPVSVIAQLVTPLFSEGLAIIEAIVNGANGVVYEYSLDQINWQSNSVFNDLSDGSYTIYVRDVKQCGVVQSNVVQTITFANFFTPNGDGYNDTWNIPGVGNNYKGKIFIYDRYGKFIKQINPDGNGWDGTFNGKELPATDYWFKAEYTENDVTREFKSHFSIKR
jgi:gliding motility-associated-like protein